MESTYCPRRQATPIPDKMDIPDHSLGCARGCRRSRSRQGPPGAGAGAARGRSGPGPPGGGWLPCCALAGRGWRGAWLRVVPTGAVVRGAVGTAAAWASPVPGRRRLMARVGVHSGTKRAVECPTRALCARSIRLIAGGRPAVRRMQRPQAGRGKETRSAASRDPRKRARRGTGSCSRAGTGRHAVTRQPLWPG